MSHSSRSRSHPDPRFSRRSAPARDFHGAVRAELAMVWIWATAPLKRLFMSVIKDGIPPPTTMQGLPPGQFPPIDAIRDELFGRFAPSAAPLEGEAARGIGIEPRGELET